MVIYVTINKNKLFLKAGLQRRESNSLLVRYRLALDASVQLFSKVVVLSLPNRLLGANSSLVPNSPRALSRLSWELVYVSLRIVSPSALTRLRVG